ncbi:Hint domain-containing protein [Pseudorhodobacter sp.]|uniref:Hint domain-containing protein n=1 Tax=Pseudorhodobacter sp. TaxID=1934400 RepID=UPI0026472D7D|nr:Hint domain-containing protein [Pseudorhodobacter sp.]MDN5787379.1 Hint domain-containing protein [Pseudorhodobacter sp.]
MRTGFQGTFVISWSQTETDGLRASPLDVLAVGATWRWTGEAIRVDSAHGVLRLEGAEGAADLRKRAAHMVRRLIGAALAPKPAELAGLDADDATDLPEQGFVVTDGLQSFTATLIDVPDSGARLVMFLDNLPPAGVELWVVRVAVDQTATAAANRMAGGVICFTPGTMVRTVAGTAQIETLRPGDLVQTKDNGAQEVIWAGHRRMTGARLYAMPHLRPIRFAAGALGQGRPDADLLVSPQHRMLVKGAGTRALFNTAEVLVAAEDLINDRSITVDLTLTEVTYVHILLARHQVIWANGLETESFHPSNTALETIEPSQRHSLLALLPGLGDNPAAYGDYARRNLARSEAAILRYELAA